MNKIALLVAATTFVMLNSGLADEVRELSDERLVAILRDAGFSGVSRGESETPESLWKIVAHQREVGIVHDSEAKQLQLVVLFNEQRARSHTLPLANRWNREQNFDRAVILKSGAWGFTRDLNYRNGLSEDAIIQAVRQFTDAIPGFLKYVESDGETVEHPRHKAADPAKVALQEIFAEAGVEEFRLEGAEREGITYRARFGKRWLLVIHNRSANRLSLRFTHKSEGRLTNELLEKANSWNDEPAIGRASIMDVDLGETSILFQNLELDFRLSSPLNSQAVIGFVKEFLASASRFDSYAEGKSADVPSIADFMESDRDPISDLPGTTMPPAGTVAQDGRLTDIWFSVVDFRHVCATEGGKGWQQFADPELLRIVDQMDSIVWAEDGDTGWSYFFARSLFDIARADTDKPLVGFYHPWSDVWLVTAWSVSPKPIITDMEMVTGEWMRQRGQPPLDLRPQWLRGEGFLPEEFALSAVTNLKQLRTVADASADWRDALRINDQWEDFNEINYPAVSMLLLNSLVRTQEAVLGPSAFEKDETVPEELPSLVAATYDFLAAGRKGEIQAILQKATATNEHSARLVRELPKNDFGNFVPTYWVSDKTHAAVFLVADHNVDFCIALTFEREAAKADLRRIDFLHLPAAVQVLEKRGTRK